MRWGFVVPEKENNITCGPWNQIKAWNCSVTRSRGAIKRENFCGGSGIARKTAETRKREEDGQSWRMDQIRHSPNDGGNRDQAGTSRKRNEPHVVGAQGEDSKNTRGKV